MSLPGFSVRRPITTTMVFLAIVLLGTISWNRLPQELFPAISYPQLSVLTTYENAAPEEVETLITKIVEEAVGTVSGVKSINSTSKEGVSLVVAEFDWGTDMDFAQLGIREKIDLIKERLPREAEEPVVIKYNPLEKPVMILSVTGKPAPAELLEVTRRVIKDELEKSEGVASAGVSGGLEREILIEIDQPRLQASGISILQIAQALQASNLNYPAGTIKESFYEYLVRTMGEFKEVDEIKDVVISVQGIDDEYSSYEYIGMTPEEKEKMSRRIIFLSDVAQVFDTFKQRESFSRYNGEENISVSILKQATANTVQVANNVRKKVDILQKDLAGRDISIEIVYDMSIFIKESIKDVRDAAIIGGILAFLILFLFLKSMRASLIVTTSIPVSIMFTFFLMQRRGITLNTMSMMGLALGVGMLVDNAVVVIENIFRHRQMGKEPHIAAVIGTEEVGGAIFSSTLTTIAVFLPIFFVKGASGQIFKEIAFTVTFSLIASLIVAFSLIPRLAMTEKGKKEAEEGLKLEKLTNFYTGLLERFLERKGFYLGVVLCIFIGSVMLMGTFNKEFLPKIDQGQFMIAITKPTGTRLEITDKVVKEVEEILFGADEVDAVSVMVGSSKGGGLERTLQTLGSHEAQIIVTLEKERRRRTDSVIQDIKQDIEGYEFEGVEIDYVLQESFFVSALKSSAPIVIEVKGHSIELLKRLSKKVMKEIERVKGIYGIKSSLAAPSPETKVHIIKDNAMLYDLSVNDIGVTAQYGIKGNVATKYKQLGKEIDIRIALREEDRDDLRRLGGLLVHSPLGIDVPLKEVAYLSHGTGPSEITRREQERVIFVTANLFKRGLSKVVMDIEGILSRLDLPIGYSVGLSGESLQAQESFKSLVFAILLSVVLVYMIMAAQFESLWQPFIIMFTLPMSLIGVSIILFIAGVSINVVTMLGMLILSGIVVNNAIVLISYLGILKSEGVQLEEALFIAVKTRLRPIMITTLTTVLGLTPLALGLGAAGELRAPMATTVIGGLLVATFLTLGVIPTLYYIGEKFIFGRRKEAKKVEG